MQVIAHLWFCALAANVLNYSAAPSFFSFLSIGFSKNPFLTADFVHHLVHGFWLLLLCILHIHLVTSNLTTNEFMGAKKYSYFKDATGKFVNPFDKGKLANAWWFFFQHQPVDWDAIVHRFRGVV